MFVHCKPWQGDLRTGVRNTWGNRRLGDINGGSKVLFVVGRNDNYREEQKGRSAWEKELSNVTIPHSPILHVKSYFTQPPDGTAARRWSGNREGNIDHCGR